MIELIENVAVKIEAVQFIQIIDILTPGEDVILQISLIDKAPINITMHQSVADDYVKALALKYNGLIIKIENYIINMDEIEYAMIEYIGQEIRLHIQFMRDVLNISMTEQEAIDYLDELAK